MFRTVVDTSSENFLMIEKVENGWIVRKGSALMSGEVRVAESPATLITIVAEWCTPPKEVAP